MGIAKTTLFLTTYLSAMATASYLTLEHFVVANRIKYNVQHYNSQIANGSFKDPAGVSLTNRVDNEGKLHLELIHYGQVQTRYEIKEDFLPPTNNIVEGLKSRVDNMKSWELQKTLDDCMQIQKQIYRRLKDE